jgi:hypothetical protein
MEEESMNTLQGIFEVINEIIQIAGNKEADVRKKCLVARLDGFGHGDAGVLL